LWVDRLPHLRCRLQEVQAMCHSFTHSLFALITSTLQNNSP